MILIVIIIAFFIVFYLDTKKLNKVSKGGSNPYEIINARIDALAEHPFRGRVKTFEKQGDGKIALYPSLKNAQRDNMKNSGGTGHLDICMKFYNELVDLGDLEGLMALRVYTSEFYTYINATTRLLNINSVSEFDRIDLDFIQKEILDIISLDRLKLAISNAKELKDALDMMEFEGSVEDKLKGLASSLKATKRFEELPGFSRVLISLTKKARGFHNPSHAILFEESKIRAYCERTNSIKCVADMVGLYSKYYTWCDRKRYSSFKSVVLNRVDRGDISLWCKDSSIVKNFSSFSYNPPGAASFTGDYMTIIATPPELKLLVISPLSVYPTETEILLPFVTIGRWVSTTTKTDLYASDILDASLGLRKLTFNNDKPTAKIAFVTYFKHYDHRRGRARVIDSNYIGYINDDPTTEISGGSDDYSSTINILALEIILKRYNGVLNANAIKDLKSLKCVDQGYAEQLSNDLYKLNYLKQKYRS